MQLFRDWNVDPSLLSLFSLLSLGLNFFVNSFQCSFFSFCHYVVKKLLRQGETSVVWFCGCFVFLNSTSSLSIQQWEEWNVRGWLRLKSMITNKLLQQMENSTNKLQRRHTKELQDPGVRIASTQRPVMSPPRRSSASSGNHSTSADGPKPVRGYHSQTLDDWVQFYLSLFHAPAHLEVKHGLLILQDPPVPECWVPLLIQELQWINWSDWVVRDWTLARVCYYYLLCVYLCWLYVDKLFITICSSKW